MEQEKIGKFIAECRKDKELTQKQLAEKLNITDKAISKWETGRGMPDSSIMINLCYILDISVNELLSGEKIEINKYNEKAEKNLLEMAKKAEYNNKKILLSINLLTFLSFLLLLIITIIISKKYISIDSSTLLKLLISLVICILVFLTAMRIELKNLHKI